MRMVSVTALNQVTTQSKALTEESEYNQSARIGGERACEVESEKENIRYVQYLRSGVSKVVDANAVTTHPFTPPQL